MAFTEDARWFLSMLHVATTWQSASRMKLPVLPGPCMPQPTTPMVMRSDGAGRPSAPSALAGMIVGAATAAAVVAIKRRREILGSMGFMAKHYAQLAIRVRVKNLSGLNCPVRFTARRPWRWQATIRTSGFETLLLWWGHRNPPERDSI